MPIPIYVVDAFADEPFEGNPAAVCLLDHEPAAEWMQEVAAEMKHAETAFVWPMSNDFGLRWFTPTTEVSLCGHATLASAKVLFSTGAAKSDEVVFHTASGQLICTKGTNYDVVMDFPAKMPEPYGEPNLEAIGRALGLEKNPVEVLAYGLDWFVVFDSQEDIEQIDPDFLAISLLGLRGMVVTAPADVEGFDFVSRFFAPGSGVPEDSVTGSAHCALAPYWAGKLRKTSMIGRQLSQRGGTVGVRYVSDRVLLKGNAIMVIEGTLLV